VSAAAKAKNIFDSQQIRRSLHKKSLYLLNTHLEENNEKGFAPMIVVISESPSAFVEFPLEVC